MTSPHQSRKPMRKGTSHPGKQYRHFPDLMAEGMAQLLLPMCNGEDSGELMKRVLPQTS